MKTASHNELLKTADRDLVSKRGTERRMATKATALVRMSVRQIKSLFTAKKKVKKVGRAIGAAAAFHATTRRRGGLPAPKAFARRIRKFFSGTKVSRVAGVASAVSAFGTAQRRPVPPRSLPPLRALRAEANTADSPPLSEPRNASLDAKGSGAQCIPQRILPGDFTGKPKGLSPGSAELVEQLSPSGPTRATPVALNDVAAGVKSSPRGLLAATLSKGMEQKSTGSSEDAKPVPRVRRLGVSKLRKAAGMVRMSKRLDTRVQHHTDADVLNLWFESHRRYAPESTLLRSSDHICACVHPFPDADYDPEHLCARGKIHWNLFEARNRAVVTFLFALEFLYLPVSTRILSFFLCEEIGDTFRVVNSREHLCFDTTWWRWFPLAVVALVCFVAMVPFLSIYSVFQKRRAHVAQYLALLDPAVPAPSVQPGSRKLTGVKTEGWFVAQLSRLGLWQTAQAHQQQLEELRAWQWERAKAAVLVSGKPESVPMFDAIQVCGLVLPHACFAAH